MKKYEKKMQSFEQTITIFLKKKKNINYKNRENWPPQEASNKQLLWSSTQKIGISFNFQDDKQIFLKTFNNSKKIIISA